MAKVDTIVFDKTGTITQNKMEVAALYSGEKLYYKKDFKHSLENIQEVLTVLVHASQRHSIDPMEKAIGNEISRLTCYQERINHFWNTF